MSRKLLRSLVAAALFLIVAAIITVFALEKVSKSKIEGVSSKATALIKAKYGIDTAVSGIDVSLLPPGIFIKKVTLSHSGHELAVMEECSLNELHKMLFSEEKKLKINCSHSRFHADKALAVQFPAKNGDKNAAANEEKRSDRDISLLFASDSEFIFGSVTQRFMTELNVSRSGGTAVFTEPAGSGGGKAEVIFSIREKSASLRLDGVDLGSFREIIKRKTSFDISRGKSSAFSEISLKNGKIFMKNDITVNDMTFFHPLIDSKPFSLPLFRFKGEITADKNTRETSIKDAELSLGGINAVFSAEYTKESRKFSIKTESAGLNKLETLIHDETFKGYLFGGTLELFAEYSQTGSEPPVFSVVGNLVEPKQLSERMDYLKSTFEYTRTGADGVKKKVFVGERNPGFTPIAFVPEHLIWAIVVSEDAGFFVHKGVDFQELDAAVKDNIKTHRMRGGSTITQQLAKNLFLNREKTLLRKFREVLLAIELDETLSKERLLEIYLNIIEWAPGVFGISHAARYYFGKKPYELTPLESAYLASVIPGPAKYHYQFLTKNVSENWYKSLYRILGIMNETGHLSTDEYFDALQETLVFREIGEE